MNADYKQYFNGKKITQMGLGLLGRGVGDALFLAECGAEVLVTDLKTEDELKGSVEKLRDVPGIIFRLGGHDLADFQNCDMVLKAAGVPLDSIYIAEARRNNIPVEMGAALLTKLAPEGVITIGITGTRGKSTTTHLIHHILVKAGKSALLGGNVRDIATLPLLKDVKVGDMVVLELDSWQLQGFGDAKISPNVSVFTAFMHDHMNYYKNDLDQYFKDKSSIYMYQKKGDVIVAGENVATIIAGKPHGEGELVIAKRKDVPSDWQIKIPGEHNLLNVSCAIEVAKALGIEMSVIKGAVESFAGVEGRLQFVKEIRGIKIYNDNNATTPDATVAGLQALGGQKIVLICGGADKALDLEKLVEEINKECKTVILIPGTGSDKLKVLSAQLQAKVLETENLATAVTKAIEIASEGDILLFSPAFASFGAYKNEYERNDEFMKIVSNLL